MIRDTLSERGVSEVIGSILVFGLIVALLTILQTQAVPSTNEDIEFQHSQQVQGDFARLSDAVTRSSVRGSSETVTLRTGTTYPNRLVLFNPPPPTGQLRSGEEAPVYLANVVASDTDAREYVDGSVGFTPGNAGVGNAPALATTGLSYRPNYNEYGSAPVTGSEYGVVYDRTDEETLVERAPEIVDGKDIDLRFLTGDYTASGLTTTVRTQPVSAGGSALAVRGANDFNPSLGNVNIYLPTDLPESVWTRELLADAIDDPDGGANGAAPEAGDTCAVVEGSVNGPGAPSNAIVGSLTQSSSFGSPDTDNDRYVRDCIYVDDPDGQNYVVLLFEPGTEYSLRMSKIGFDSDQPLDPQYVVAPEGSASLGEAGEREVSVQVRDRYNNPVSGVELEATLTTPGNAPTAIIRNTTGSANAGNAVTTTTDEDGVATVDVVAGSSFASGEVTFSGTFDGVSDPDQQAASVVVTAAGSPPVTLTSAALSDSDAVNLTVRNEGPARSVAGVQVHEVTVEDKKRVVESADLLTGTTQTILGIANVLTDNASVDVGMTNATDVIDGPSGVTGLSVDGSGTVLNPGAPEGGPPVGVPSVVAGQTIDSGETVTLQFILDRDVTAATGDGNFEEGDAVRMRVTVTYSDGHRETYDVRVETPEDDER